MSMLVWLCTLIILIYLAAVKLSGPRNSQRVTPIGSKIFSKPGPAFPDFAL